MNLPINRKRSHAEMIHSNAMDIFGMPVISGGNDAMSGAHDHVRLGKKVKKMTVNNATANGNNGETDRNFGGMRQMGNNITDGNVVLTDTDKKLVNLLLSISNGEHRAN